MRRGSGVQRLLCLLQPSQRSPTHRTANPVQRFSRVWLSFHFCRCCCWLLPPAVYNYLRAASILLAIADTHSALSGFDTNPVTEELITYPSGSSHAGARIYHPIGVAHPSAIVVVHGAQCLGMNEPRLRDLPGHWPRTVTWCLRRRWMSWPTTASRKSRRW